MSTLEIVAHVPGPIALPHGPIALDSLLASQVAIRSGLPPASSSAECVPIEIPVEREPGGSFHLCSFSVGELREFELRHVNRRAPVEQYTEFGVRGRVALTTGADKSYRVPLEVGHLRDSRLTWWAIGDADEIRDLLSSVLYLGKKRSVGLGRVTRWGVTECEPWDGFPVVRDGRPLRTLPPAWPGLEDPDLRYAVMTYPYFDHGAEQLCAVP